MAVTGSGPEMMEKGTETWPSREGVERSCACAASEGAHPAEMLEDSGAATGKQLSPGTPAAPPAALPMGWASQTRIAAVCGPGANTSHRVRAVTAAVTVSCHGAWGREAVFHCVNL